MNSRVLKRRRKRLWHYIASYRFHSLFVRNFAITIVLLIIPLMVMSNIVTTRSGAIIREEIRLLSLQSLQKVKDVADSLVFQTSTLSESLAKMPEVEIAVRSDIADVILGKEYLVQITGHLKNLLSANEYLRSIYIYSDKYGNIIDNQGRYDLDGYEDIGWHSTYLGLRGSMLKPILRSVRDLNPIPTYRDVISLIRTVAVVGSERMLGAVVVNLRLDYIEREMKGAEPGASTIFFLVDSSGAFYFLRGDPLIESGILREHIERIVEREVDSGPIFCEVEGTGYTFALIDSAYYPWKYAMCIPSDFYVARIEGFRKFTTVLLAVIILITLIISFLISMKTFKPIARIMRLVENPLSKLRGDRDNKSDSDEVRYIAKRIVRFAYINNQLRTEVRRQIEAIDRIQGVALDAQIHPHFLYNTLESIRWAAVGLTKGENKASEMIQDLSALLRISLDTENNLLPLATEIDHAKRYVRLMNYRHENRFSVIWSVHDDMLDCKVTKLLLQPLIENAIYHGLKPKRYVGKVEIYTEECVGGIELSVSDDGVGMTPRLCKELNESFEKSFNLDHDHIGLRNINQRVRLVFGSGFGLSVQSEENTGTCVKVRIPRIS